MEGRNGQEYRRNRGSEEVGRYRACQLHFHGAVLHEDQPLSPPPARPHREISATVIIFTTQTTSKGEKTRGHPLDYAQRAVAVSIPASSGLSAAYRKPYTTAGCASCAVLATTALHRASFEARLFIIARPPLTRKCPYSPKWMRKAESHNTSTYTGAFCTAPCVGPTNSPAF